MDQMDSEKMCSKMIKESLDKKFGPSWHVIVGEGYALHVFCKVLSCLCLEVFMMQYFYTALRIVEFVYFVLKFETKEKIL